MKNVKIKTVIKYFLYTLLACVFTSCLDKVVSTNEKPFIIKNVESIGNGLYKYRNNGDYCTGVTVDYIVLDVKYTVGDTLFISNAR